MPLPFDKDANRREVLIPHAKAGKLPCDYDALGLDASTAISDAELEQRIASIRTFWHAEKRSSSRAKLVEALLAELPAIERRMKDPEERRRQAEVKRARDDEDAERRAVRVDKVKEALRDFVARGAPITPEQIRSLADFVGDRALFDRLLAEAGVGLADAAPRGPAPLDKATRKRIKNLLFQYRESGLSTPGRTYVTLYDYLEDHGVARAPDGGPPEQSAIAAGVRTGRDKARNMAYGAERTLLDELSAECNLLASGEREAYDASRIADFEDEVSEQLLLRFVSSGAVIDCSAMEHLCDGASAHGLQSAQAVAAVRRAAERHHVRLFDDAALHVALLRCSVCHEIAVDRGQRECAHCGEPHYTRCPGCREDAQTSLRDCHSCGLNLQARRRAERRLGQARRELEQRRLLAALEHGRAAAAADPDYAAAFVAEQERTLAEVRTRWDQALAALAAAQPYTAHEHLTGVARAAVDILAPDGTTVDAALARARERIERAEAFVVAARSTSDREQAEAAYVRALDAATDSRAAREALAALPPAPPSGVSAEATAAGVRVRWQGSRSLGEVRYVVRRGDTVVARTAGVECEDTSAPAGAPAVYLVLAERAGAHSAPAPSSTVTAAPGLRGAIAEPGDDQVRLRWEAGHGRLQIARRPGSAQVTVDLSATTYLDVGVANGTAYEYVLTPHYERPDGTPIAGPSTKLAAVPEAPPQPIVDVHVEPDGDRVTIRFEAPATGNAAVYRTEVAPAGDPGRELSAAEVAAFGAPLPGSVDAQPPTIAWYVPVTTAAGTAVLGRAVRHVRAPSVRDLDVEDRRRELRLSWVWPEDSDAALVVWRADAPPTGAADPEARRLAITRTRYGLEGCTVTVDPRGSIHLEIYLGVRVDGELIYGAGGPANRHTVARVSREIRYRVSKRRRRGIVVDVESADGPVPELVLVHHSAVLPALREAAERELGTLRPQDHRHEFAADEAVLRRGYVRVFLASDSDAARFRLVDPPASTLRLG